MIDLLFSLPCYVFTGKEHKVFFPLPVARVVVQLRTGAAITASTEHLTINLYALLQVLVLVLAVYLTWIGYK